MIKVTKAVFPEGNKYNSCKMHIALFIIFFMTIIFFIGTKTAIY